MCFCSTLGLKIFLWILIAVTAGFNAGQIANDINIWDIVQGYQRIILIVSLSMSVIVIVSLVPLVYATIRKSTRIIYGVVIILVLNFVGKLIILFVCICTEKNPDKTAAHYMFIISWFITFLCMALVTVYWIRLCDLAIENEQN